MFNLLYVSDEGNAPDKTIRKFIKNAENLDLFQETMKFSHNVLLQKKLKVANFVGQGLETFLILIHQIVSAPEFGFELPINAP